jgi:hypothetical protein
LKEYGKKVGVEARGDRPGIQGRQEKSKTGKLQQGYNEGRFSDEEYWRRVDNFTTICGPNV